MPEASRHEVTELLLAWQEGDQRAFERLLPLVYGELHLMAKQYMAHEKPGHTLQTTALINEAYLRLVRQEKQKQWQNRAHFFGVASQVMRHVLIDHARKHCALKRGDGIEVASLEEAAGLSFERAAVLVALDDALDLLKTLNLRQAQIVEMRYFGGLSVQETAKALNLSPPTVWREWAIAKAWLLRALTQRKEP